ncbi:uracil-DNA glycosylase family protein [Aliamphritea hakodatensis]|uniref:uracil-DNA glycosylase family protein n=1 Tax=Aliamphritea hakodatensis TaxID=2895352 RepID=UPI0022FD8234|nr:uracil-DNA glycosylase family protein [Aliamphritea hakodatensis]
MQSIEEISREARACRLCEPALPHGVRPVFQVSAQARILIAGQAPGRRVHTSGIPFDDPSGDRLRQWLGVDKDTFYDPDCFAIVPMGFCYPGTGKSGDLAPRKECAPAWREKMLAALPALELNLLIGQYAQAWHLGKSDQNLTERVKDWQSYYETEPGKVRNLPLPHPSPRNNIWLKRNPWFEELLIPELQRMVALLLNKKRAP